MTSHGAWRGPSPQSKPGSYEEESLEIAFYWLNLLNARAFCTPPGMQSIKTTIFEKKWTENTIRSGIFTRKKLKLKWSFSRLSLRRLQLHGVGSKKLKPRNAKTWDKSKSLLSTSRLPESELSLNYLNKLPEATSQHQFLCGLSVKEKILFCLSKAQENIALTQIKTKTMEDTKE